MQTRQIDLRPIYEDNRLAGYEAAGTLQVTLPQPEAVGLVIDPAVAAGTNQVHGIAFQVRDPRPYEARAWLMAVQPHDTLLSGTEFP